MSISTLAHRELRARWRKHRPLLAAGIALHGIGAACVLARAWRAATGLPDAIVGDRILADTTMFSCAALVLTAPALTGGLAGAESPAALRARLQALLAYGPARAAAGTLVPLVMVVTAFTAASAIPLLLAAAAGIVAPGSVFAGHTVLLTFGVAVVLLGALIAWSVRDDHAAIGLIYLVVLLTVAAPILAGPTISRVFNADQLIAAMLLANPFSAVARAIDFDIARSRAVYVWSPIGQRRFNYPGWGESAMFFGAVALLSLAGSMWLLRRYAAGAEP